MKGDCIRVDDFLESPITVLKKTNDSSSAEFNDVDYFSSTLSVGGASVTAGETATLYCGTVGYNSGATPTYSWYKVGSDDATEQVTENQMDYNRTQVLKDVMTSESYTCKACLAGTCKSNVITLSVTQATATLQFVVSPPSYLIYEMGKDEGALDINCTTSLGKVTSSANMSIRKPITPLIFPCSFKNDSMSILILITHP